LSITTTDQISIGNLNAKYLICIIATASYVKPISNYPPPPAVMVPAKHIATALTPAAEDGVNLLWTFQLRKENAGLLEKLQASERTIQASASESTRYFQEVNDRVAALEARLSKIESEEKKDRQAIESWSAAVRTLRRKVDAGLEKPNSAGELNS
jgi:hypothetical protein